MLGLWTLRAVGAGGLAFLGWGIGGLVSDFSSNEGQLFPLGLAITLASLPVGGLVNPWRKGADFFGSIPGPSLIACIVGLIVGLVIALLISIPLYTLDGWMGWGIPIILSLSLGLLGAVIGAQRKRDMQAIFPALENSSGADKIYRNGSIVVDTSAIIDGRIADLSITGFLEGSLVVPRFVLDELRHIADSSDPLRRNGDGGAWKCWAVSARTIPFPWKCWTWAWPWATRWTPSWCAWPRG